MLTVRAAALLRPRTCTSRYKQPPCYASRTRPPRGKSSGFLLCMLFFCHGALTIDNVAIHQP